MWHPGQTALRQFGTTALQKSLLAAFAQFIQLFLFFGGRDQFRPVAYAGDDLPVDGKAGARGLGQSVDAFPVVAGVKAAASVPRSDKRCRLPCFHKKVAQSLPVKAGGKEEGPVLPRPAGVGIGLFAHEPQDAQGLEIGCQRTRGAAFEQDVRHGVYPPRWPASRQGARVLPRRPDGTAPSLPAGRSCGRPSWRPVRKTPAPCRPGTE